MWLRCPIIAEHPADEDYEAIDCDGAHVCVRVWRQMLKLDSFFLIFLTFLHRLAPNPHPTFFRCRDNRTTRTFVSWSARACLMSHLVSRAADIKVKLRSSSCSLDRHNMQGWRCGCVGVGAALRASLAPPGDDNKQQHQYRALASLSSLPRIVVMAAPACWLLALCKYRLSPHLFFFLLHMRLLYLSFSSCN